MADNDPILEADLRELDRRLQAIKEAARNLGIEARAAAQALQDCLASAPGGSLADLEKEYPRT